MISALDTPCVIYPWKEEIKRIPQCHLRMGVSPRPLEIWGNFGNRPKFSKLSTQLFVSRVYIKSGRSVLNDIGRNMTLQSIPCIFRVGRLVNSLERFNSYVGHGMFLSAPAKKKQLLVRTHHGGRQNGAETMRYHNAKTIWWFNNH